LGVFSPQGEFKNSIETIAKETSRNRLQTKSRKKNFLNKNPIFFWGDFVRVPAVFGVSWQGGFKTIGNKYRQKKSR
jgi:hypothetical protein